MEEEEFSRKVLAAIKYVPVDDKATMAQMFDKVKEITEQQRLAIDAGDWAKHDALQEELRPVWAEIAKNFKFVKPDGE